MLFFSSNLITLLDAEPLKITLALCLGTKVQQSSHLRDCVDGSVQLRPLVSLRCQLMRGSSSYVYHFAAFAVDCFGQWKVEISVSSCRRERAVPQADRYLSAISVSESAFHRRNSVSHLGTIPSASSLSEVFDFS